MAGSPLSARNSESGSVLVLALLLSMFLVSVGIASLWLSSSGTRIAANLTRRQEAMYSAESGVGRAQMVLGNSGDWPTLLKGTACGATVDALKGTVLCDGATALVNAPMVGPSSTTAGEAPSIPDMRYTIYVRNDTEEYSWCNGVVDPGETADDGDCTGDGSAESDDWRRTEDRDGRVIVRVEGSGRDQISYFGIEATLVRGAGELTGEANYNQEGGDSLGSGGGEAAVAAP